MKSMIDTTQLLLISAITIMTILFTVVGIQLIIILRDLRTLLSRVNGIMSEFEKVGGSLTHSYSEVLGFFSGVKNLFLLVDTLTKKRKK